MTATLRTPLRIRRGDDYFRGFQCVDKNKIPIPLATYGDVWRCQFRANKDTSVFITATCTWDNQGKWTITIPGAHTALLPPSGVWDVQVTNTSTGATSTLFEGTFILVKDVTQ